MLAERLERAMMNNNNGKSLLTPPQATYLIRPAIPELGPHRRSLDGLTILTGLGMVACSMP